MEWQVAENQICPVSTFPFGEDACCFFVLERILKGPCRLTVFAEGLSVLCHSADPYPVWVWLSPDATEEEIAQTYGVLKQYFLTKGNYHYNMTHALATKMTELARADGITLSLEREMLVYDCPCPVPAQKAVDGQCVKAVPSALDVETATAFVAAFHKEAGLDETTPDTYRAQVKELIAQQRLFFWKNEKGEAVAMASYSETGAYGCVSSVYTVPPQRRRGYAANLVYAITCHLLERGKTPLLYTDAHYAASNACYQTIGYCQKGSLCTVKPLV